MKNIYLFFDIIKSTLNFITIFVYTIIVSLHFLALSIILLNVSINYVPDGYRRRRRCGLPNAHPSTVRKTKPAGTYGVLDGMAIVPIETLEK